MKILYTTNIRQPHYYTICWTDKISLSLKWAYLQYILFCRERSINFVYRYTSSTRAVFLYFKLNLNTLKRLCRLLFRIYFIFSFLYKPKKRNFRFILVFNFSGDLGTNFFFGSFFISLLFNQLIWISDTILLLLQQYELLFWRVCTKRFFINKTTGQNTHNIQQEWRGYYYHEKFCKTKCVFFVCLIL